MPDVASTDIAWHSATNDRSPLASSSTHSINVKAQYVGVNAPAARSSRWRGLIWPILLRRSSGFPGSACEVTSNPPRCKGAKIAEAAIHISSPPIHATCARHR